MIIVPLFMVFLGIYNAFDKPAPKTSQEIYLENKQNNPMNVQPEDNWDGV